MEKEEFSRFFDVFLAHFVDLRSKTEGNFVKSVQNLLVLNRTLAQKVASNGGENLGGGESVLSVLFTLISVF
jgi:hypothetical protein